MMENRLLIVLGVILATASAFRPIASEWIALILIILAGIPHGSFDLRLATAKWGSRVRSGAIVALVYIMAGAAMGALCLLQPGIGFLTFLVISAFHFSQGESTYSNRYTAACLGVGAILFPIAFHLTDAGRYLSFFVSPTNFQLMVPWVRGSGYVLFAVTLVLIWLEVKGGNCKELLQWTICIVGWVFLPPLSGFCLWFIGRHSLQHVTACRKLLTGRNKDRSLDLLAISVMGVLLIAPLSYWFDFKDLSQLFAASIVLIAGLTLPHIIVTYDFQTTRRLLAISLNEFSASPCRLPVK